jgi:BON domain
MSPNDREQSTRVFHREYKDAVGNIHTEYKDADGNIYTEYKDIDGNIHINESGNLEDQLVEEQIQNARVERANTNIVERADTNISKGLLIGVISTCVTGLTAGFIYFLTRPNAPQPASVTNVPTHESTQAPSPVPSQQVRVVGQPTVTPVPQTQSSGSTENTTTQPSVSNPSTSNPSTKPGSAANPAQNSSTSVPKPPVATPADGNAAGANVNTTDSQIKNEILKQFQTNLPKNQLIVDVSNGDVTVSGKAATLKQLQGIQLLLGSIKGIRRFNITATAPPKT